MASKSSIYRPQTNTQHRDDVAQNTNSHLTAMTQSRASSFHFLSEMIVELVRTLSTALQSKTEC